VPEAVDVLIALGGVGFVLLVALGLALAGFLRWAYGRQSS
jgi:hypothetical protein